MAIYSNMLLTMVATKEAAIELQDELYSKMETWKKTIEELLKSSYGKPYQLDFKVKTPEEIVKIMLECDSSLMIADYEGANYNYWKVTATNKIRKLNGLIIFSISVDNENDVKLLDELFYNSIDWDAHFPAINHNDAFCEPHYDTYQVDGCIDISIMEKQTIRKENSFSIYNFNYEKYLAEKLQERFSNCLENYRTFIETLLKANYGKPYQIDYRVKSPEKIVYKLQTRLKEKAFAKDLIIHMRYNDEECRMALARERLSLINDQVGIRISVDDENEVLALIKLLGDFFTPEGTADYFSTPKESGFKAFVYYLTIDGINIEIQLMTNKMRDWTNQTHDEYDIKTYGRKFKKQL